MAKKKKKKAGVPLRKNPPRGWMRATAVKIVRGRNGTRVLVKKAKGRRR
jgi:hypothetical protein